jgi:aspartyl-tRNA(Asn)/glutamyl-tRNA(Gln) amidotransferase subunit C
VANYTREKILHVAKLAHLELPETEIAERLREFNEIVGYIEKLDRLPTDGIEPTAQVLPSDDGTPLADDRPAPSLPVDEVLKNAPARQDRFFKVPRMIGEEE